jgi:hypothetical protein
MVYQLMFVVLLALSLGMTGTGAGAENISGTWAFSINLEGGPQNVKNTLVFKQEGEKLTGSQSGGLGDHQITGTVKGDKVTFGFDLKWGDQTAKVTYNGTIQSPTKMSGTLEFPKGPGNWTATRN